MGEARCASTLPHCRNPNRTSSLLFRPSCRHSVPPYSCVILGYALLASSRPRDLLLPPCHLTPTFFLQVVEQNTSINGWAIGLILVLAALMAFSVLSFSKISLAAYLGEDKGVQAQNGSPGTGIASGAAGQARGKRFGGMWTVVKGLFAGAQGGGTQAPAAVTTRAGGAGVKTVSGAVASREVNSARERERLLRSEV